MNVFLLKPSAKDYLWGGNRINEKFNKGFNISPLAETWECSTHPDGPSFIVGGEFDGKTLAEVLNLHPEFLGTKHTQLPILVKFIDARQALSVQVHPDDDYAREFENGSLGKSEMWYVVDAEPGASLVYGLNKTADKQEVKDLINEGQLESILNSVPVSKGDSFFIKAGTIHAIGAGCLIAEIQQSSNLTYRLYDFNRRDKNGKLRELHIDKALDVANLSVIENGPSVVDSGSSVIENGPSVIASESVAIPSLDQTTICECPYFKVDKLILNSSITYKTNKDSFGVLLCLEGQGKIDNQTFKKGDCLFISADSELVLEANAELLSVNC